MLSALFEKLRNLIRISGYDLLITKPEMDYDINLLNKVKLHERNIANLKIIPNREDLLKLLPKNGIVAELGVNKGDFSQQILKITQPKLLILIDTWDSDNRKYNFVNKRFTQEMDSGKIKIIRGRSEKEIQKFSNEYFDWIYIDTTHAYSQTLQELELCRLKVKQGGVIAGHDYCQGNINKAIPYGIVLAVNKFCLKYDWEFIYLTHETDRFLSYALKKII